MDNTEGERLGLIGGAQRYEAVQVVRVERGSKLKTIASAAACVFLVALGATIVLDAVHKSSAPSAARISDAVKGLAVSGSSSAAGGFFLRAGLSPKHHAPAQELHEMLAQSDSLRHFTMLEQIDVKRAMACPIGNRCQYFGYSEVEQKSTVVEYEADKSDPNGKTMKQSKESSGSTKAKLKVTFDVYETNITGCQSDTIAWAINITACESGDLETGGEGSTAGSSSETKVPDNSTLDDQMTQALGIYPFTVIQDRNTGAFKDYVIDRKEDPKDADIKRSLAKDLNPVIDVLTQGMNKAQVGAKGEILFRMMEHDMNGHHHNVYMLKRNAGGRGIHEIQHIRSFMLDQGESHASERSDGESGNPNDAAGNERASVPNGDGEPAEPETCPYKVKDITDSAGQHSRTAKTEGDAVDESKDEGKLALGKKPEKLEEMPTKTSEQSAENTRVNPVESRTAMKSQYGLKRLSTTPEDSICAGATVSSKDPSSPLSILKQQTAYGGTSLAPKDSFMEVTTTEVPGGQGGPNDMTREREVDLVVYSFNGPQLHNHHDDHAKHYGSQAHAEAHAMEILDMAISSHEKFEHGESDKLIRACRTDQVREALFSYLSNPENNREHRHNAAIKVLGACSFVINQHQAKVEKSILKLAAEKDTPETVRDQSILALIALDCPSIDTLRSMDVIIKEESDTPVGETATLAMGALLKSRRICNKKIGLQDRHTTTFEDMFNTQLKSAMKRGDMDRADTVLLAMYNSGGVRHLQTIKECLEEHNFQMRSVDLKHATKLALTAIGEHVDSADKALHQQLLLQIEAPLNVHISDINRDDVHKPLIKGVLTQMAKSMPGKKEKALSAAHEKLTQLAQKQRQDRTSALQEVDENEVSPESYGLTFVATGCCNYQPATSWWSSQSPSTVFNDMYAYCTLVKGGRASPSQRSFCGCGDAPPSTCTLQTVFRVTEEPPEEEPVEEEEDWGHCADEGGTCSCTGQVRYGTPDCLHTADLGGGRDGGGASCDQWSTYKPEVDGGINCVTAIFGWDPAPGVAKVCQCLEKEIDPRKCLGGEDPLVCYGKRIPQEGMVRGLLGIFGGVAEAMDLGKKCQKYAYAKATGTVEVYTGIPIAGLNPISLDIVKLEGRLLLGPKCRCKATKTDKCPKKCKKNKQAKPAKNKNRTGGHLMIMGVIYKKFGKLRLGEPYIPGKRISFPEVPPPGFEYEDAGSPPDWGTVGSQRDVVGFCRFSQSNFDKKTFINQKYIPIRGVDGAQYWLGPVNLRLYAHIALSNGAELAVTGTFQDGEDLLAARWGWKECEGGGRAGFGKAFMRASVAFGGVADIWFFQARLGAELTFFNLDAGFSGELLEGGYGKEAVVSLNGVSGYVRGTVFQRRFHCWWYCCHHCCWWGCFCCCWALACNSWWHAIWDHTFASFSVRGIDNMLCTSWLTKLGCPEYSQNDIARQLHSIDVGLRKFIKESREQAEAKAALYRQGFLDEAQAQSAAAKELIQAKFATEIQQARDAKALADAKIAEYNAIKTKLEAHLRWIGVCKYQDIDPASGKKMRMLAQAPERRRIAAKAHVTVLAETNKCSYLGPGGDDYRGTVDHTGDGTKCLPWPKGWVLKYHGSGLAKDIEGCADQLTGTRCYESCLEAQETNNYCRNPTDAAQPFCRTGGTDEAPTWSKCETVTECPDDGCTHDSPDGSDYKGEISFTVSGKTCDPWKGDEKWRGTAVDQQWHNYCRNPDGKKLPWCLIQDAPSGWEFCDVGKSCSDDTESVTRVAEVKEAGPVLPFPTEGLYAHYTTRGWERTKEGQWDDESGNQRHSISTTGQLLQGLASGNGAKTKVGYLSGGTLMSSVTFPSGSIPETFSICSVSRYANADGNGQIVSARDKDWFNGHNKGAGVAYYGKWMTASSNTVVSGTDWLIMCGQNGDAPSILANGKDVSLKVAGGAGGAQLMINKEGFSSMWDVVGISIWNRILSADEVKQAGQAYADFLNDGGAFGISLKGEARDEPFPRTGIHSHFTPNGWQKTVPGRWDDESGFERHSLKSAGAISLKTDAGNGAGGTVAYLTAGTDGSIVFGEGSIPQEFTICSLSRYAGNAKNKIIAKVDVKGDCMTNDIGAECWFHGHEENKVGVAYYNQWKTPTTSFLPGDKITDWIVMCGQNKVMGVQLANGMERTVHHSYTAPGHGGGDGGLQLAINGHNGLQNSDWALHGLTIWDRHLSRHEITAASNAYLKLLATGGDSIEMRS